jgi:hypothetical protein
MDKFPVSWRGLMREETKDEETAASPSPAPSASPQAKAKANEVQ